MKIVDVQVQTFHYLSNTVRDSDGHGHPGPAHDAQQTLLTIRTDEGVAGFCFGANAQIVESMVKPLLMGEDPFFHEKIWHMLKERQRLALDRLSDKVLAAVDVALWDLVGRALNQPVYKLLGATRTKVPAYASTMCGDDLVGGLNTPEAYAEFALQCKARGYTAFKLHTWQPPYSADPKRDVAACAAVREAVGPDMALMIDPYHYYSRHQALYLGRELEKLGFYWMEEPMDEHSMSSYIWLADQLDLAIVGPETVEGKMYSRAEWIVHHACDMTRAGVRDVGGITPMMKIVHLAESFNMQVESHGPDMANLHVLCAMGIRGEYHERGLLHPFIDYETPQPWLNQIVDPMDDEGNVHVSDAPGLGMDINFDYIQANLIQKA
ncbi:MAG: enolase [Anaerolineae bacterium]|nr:enolase [Anaerolineae bacterium]